MKDSQMTDLVVFRSLWLLILSLDPDIISFTYIFIIKNWWSNFYDAGNLIKILHNKVWCMANWSKS